MTYANPTINTEQEAARILREAGHALLQCADRLSSPSTPPTNECGGFQHAVGLMHQAVSQGGKIVITGVGKSGKIAEKLVATFLSLGNLALFLHPTEALHGDLGMVSPRDAVLAISYSGKTPEILQLLPFLHQRGAHLISMVGNLASPLALASEAVIDAQVQQEATPDIPAPTTSTTLSLALGDALAMCLMRQRACTPSLFASNHPGGSLGQIMAAHNPKSSETPPILSSPSAPLCDLAQVTRQRLKQPTRASEAHGTHPEGVPDKECMVHLVQFTTPPDSPPCGLNIVEQSSTKTWIPPSGTASL